MCWNTSLTAHSATIVLRLLNQRSYDRRNTKIEGKHFCFLRGNGTLLVSEWNWKYYTDNVFHFYISYAGSWKNQWGLSLISTHLHEAYDFSPLLWELNQYRGNAVRKLHITNTLRLFSQRTSSSSLSLPHFITIYFSFKL